MDLQAINTFLASPTVLWITVIVEIFFAYGFFRNALRFPGLRRTFFLVTGAGWVVMISATASFLLDKLGIYTTAAAPVGMVVIMVGFGGLYFTKDTQPLAKPTSPKVAGGGTKEVGEGRGGQRRKKKRRRSRK